MHQTNTVLVTHTRQLDRSLHCTHAFRAFLDADGCAASSTSPSGRGVNRFCTRKRQPMHVSLTRDLHCQQHHGSDQP